MRKRENVPVPLDHEATCYFLKVELGPSPKGLIAFIMTQLGLNPLEYKFARVKFWAVCWQEHDVNTEHLSHPNKDIPNVFGVMDGCIVHEEDVLLLECA